MHPARGRMIVDGAKSQPQVAEMSKKNAVCLCTDRNMLIPALFVANAVQSLAAKIPDSFDLIVVAEPAEVTDTHRQWMEEHGILLCENLDTGRYDDIEITDKRLSPATLAKLFLAQHFAGRYEKILYLDADLTLHDDISAIFAVDTGEFALAAVPSGRIWAGGSAADRKTTEDHFHALGMTPPYRFFNTGVLLIDVGKWNTQDLGDRTVGFIRRNPDLCSLPDEHGLNGVLDGHLAELSPIWNMRPARHYSETIPAIVRPVIVHHAGGDKPWRRYGYGKRLFPDRTGYGLYESFIEDTPWPRWLDEQWSGRDLRKTITWEIRRFTRGLRGKSREPTRHQLRDYSDAFLRFCATHDFVDVDQGIVTRENGGLQLGRSRGASA